MEEKEEINTFILECIEKNNILIKQLEKENEWLKTKVII